MFPEKNTATPVMAATKKRWILFFCVALYMALAGYVLAHFAMMSHVGDPWRAATLEASINGTAEKPYVYRMLVPKVIGFLVNISPAALQEYVNTQLAGINQNPLVKKMVDHRRGLENVLAEPGKFYMRLVALLVVYACLMGFVWAQYKLTAQLLPGRDAVALAAPVIGLLLVPALSYPTLYLYDMGVLLLSACCYYAMATKRLRWYYACFALACLNKESAIFIALFFGLWNAGRMPRQQWLKHVLAQCVMWAAIKHGLYLAYLHNPGIFLATYYRDLQLVTLIKGYSYSQWATFAFIAVLLTYHWHDKPLFARHGLWVLAAMFVAYILYGKPYEYRVFYDIMPLMTVLITHTLITFAIPSSGRGA